MPFNACVVDAVGRKVKRIICVDGDDLDITRIEYSRRADGLRVNSYVTHPDSPVPAGWEDVPVEMSSALPLAPRKPARRPAPRQRRNWVL